MDGTARRWMEWVLQDIEFAMIKTLTFTHFRLCGMRKRAQLSMDSRKPIESPLVKARLRPWDEAQFYGERFARSLATVLPPPTHPAGTPQRNLAPLAAPTIPIPIDRMHRVMSSLIACKCMLCGSTERIVQTKFSETLELFVSVCEVCDKLDE